MPKFKPGESGNIHGKPKGTKSKVWFKIGYWFDELQKDWDKLTPNQRSHYSVELMKLLTSKAKAIPTDPDDSKFNVTESMEMLKQIEKTAGSGGETGIAIPPEMGQGQV